MFEEFAGEFIINESKERNTLSVLIPGSSKDNVSVKVLDNVLSISVDNGNSSFAQEFHMPKNADSDNISCRVCCGILSIEIPKKIDLPRSIEIK